MEFEAVYHDGETSRSELVSVSVSEEGVVTLTSSSPTSLIASHVKECRWQELVVQPRIANTPRWIRLPNGAQLETADNDLVDQVQEHFQTGAFNRLIHSLEHSWWMILIGVVFTVVFLWGGVHYGLPVAAKYGAEVIPQDVLYPLGDDVQVWMDENLFESSQLEPDRQEELKHRFQRILKPHQNYTLVFLASPKLGANALALPNDHIILTDELVELATSDHQIIAVLAHEIGHLEHRHALRRLLQQAGLASILMVFAGDVSSVSSAVVYLPALLIELGYSREFEYEADQYAIEFLDQQGMDVDYFAQILSRLAEQPMDESEESSKQNHQDDDQSNKYFEYLSTHPGVDARIQRINAWRREPN
ncbi:M48 family metallopeptidase [Litoribrevibacter albus]|uniref:Peptidase M48 n=1 Tax=Litoribrevibacter albus TaxID=1473156 RepID=A0AA37WA65_9GAMM|nr:M48 family metallopeptidase [Litoribrevibacter albus]GLQ33266.1 peptidase M48 [Litoribrevibacter albus]